MRWWKVLGLAGLAGVAASGVVIARAERRRRAYTPEEIRDRLRERAKHLPTHANGRIDLADVCRLIRSAS